MRACVRACVRLCVRACVSASFEVQIPANADKAHQVLGAHGNIASDTLEPHNEASRILLHAKDAPVHAVELGAVQQPYHTHLLPKKIHSKSSVRAKIHSQPSVRARTTPCTCAPGAGAPDRSSSYSTTTTTTCSPCRAVRPNTSQCPCPVSGRVGVSWARPASVLSLTDGTSSKPPYNNVEGKPADERREDLPHILKSQCPKTFPI